MKKCKIIFLIIIASFKFGTAQSYLNKTFHFLSNDSLTRTENYNAAIEIPGTGFLALSNSWNYSNNTYQLLFDGIDYSGNLTFQKTFGDSGDAILPMDIHFLADSSIGVLADKGSTLNDTSYICFMRLNSIGDTLSTRTYSSGNIKTHSRKFISTLDSGYVMVGWSGPAQNQHGLMYMIKTDNNGNIQWTKEYGDTSRFNVATSVTQLSDSGYFITAWFSEGVSNTYKRDSKLIRTDAQGNELWERTYGVVDLFDNIEQMIKVDENNYAMIGTRCLGPVFNENGDVWFLLVDSLGNIIQNKHSGGPFIEEGNHFINKDNKFYCSGIHSNFSSGHTMGYLLLLNSIGDSLWSQSYVYDSTSGSYDDAIWGMSLCADGGFLLCGQAGPGSTGTQDAWLLKLDSNGCADTACSMLVSVIDNSQLKANSCLLYPNPSSGYSNLLIGEDFLYQEINITINDLSGNLISSNFILFESKQQIIPLRKVKPGVYLVSVKSGIKEQIIKWIVLN